MGIIVHRNEQLIRDFYSAFAARDAEAMALCYHADIRFSDPAFTLLQGNEAGDMWRMLVSRGKDLTITLLSVSADENGGHARWEARYTFSQTGKFVINTIDAVFAFRDGRIVRHIDHFSFWKWSRQALGLAGLLLGWSWPMKSIIRKKAMASLLAYREHNATKG
jgi:ketosteroid isomerase-like protein